MFRAQSALRASRHSRRSCTAVVDADYEHEDEEDEEDEAEEDLARAKRRPQRASLAPCLCARCPRL